MCDRVGFWVERSSRFLNGLQAKLTPSSGLGFP